MPDDVDKTQLFEFGYAQANYPNSVTGTGVGLYQIAELINNTMKGEVDIFNNTGTGVTLEVKIYEI